MRIVFFMDRRLGCYKVGRGVWCFYGWVRRGARLFLWMGEAWGLRLFYGWIGGAGV